MLKHPAVKKLLLVFVAMLAVMAGGFALSSGASQELDGARNELAQLTQKVNSPGAQPIQLDQPKEPRAPYYNKVLSEWEERQQVERALRDLTDSPGILREYFAVNRQVLDINTLPGFTLVSVEMRVMTEEGLAKLTDFIEKVADGLVVAPSTPLPNSPPPKPRLTFIVRSEIRPVSVAASQMSAAHVEGNVLAMTMQVSLVFRGSHSEW